MVVSLSEDSRLGSLRELIADAARNEKNGLLMFSMGVVLVNLGLVVGILGNNAIGYVGGVFAVVLGTVSTFFGFYIAVYYSRRCNNLLEKASKIER